MTGFRSKPRKKAKLLPFRVRKILASLQVPERGIPDKLAQYLLATTAQVVASMLEDEADTLGVVSGDGFWYFPDKGDIARPLLVAHVDTVCETFPPRSLATEDSLLYNPDGILGADDRAGVYAAYVLRQRTGVGVLLCDEEESGAHGAHTAARVIGDLVKTHPYMVELDRQGYREVVFYRDECDAFIRHMESYGFTKRHGSFSDISVLSRELDVPGANVSVGFHWQHSRSEHLDLDELADTIKRMTALIKENKAVTFTPIVKTYGGYRGYDFTPYKYKPREPVIVEAETISDADLADADTLSSDEIDDLVSQHFDVLTTEQIDRLTAIQVERIEQERLDDIEALKMREQEDDIESLYDWWHG